MLKTVDKKMQDYYNAYRREIGTPADFKRFSRLPGELTERLEENFLDEFRQGDQILLNKIAAEDRKVLIGKLIRFLTGGILLALLLALFLNTVVDPLLRFVVS
ncbi:MAG: hypothetical protein U1D31_02875 [Patescibacteria group bacterium]|nr:hypothetical protein [bacterium]MDZ4241036.1 hypothetical protein [Patescibacteria group bacterium]